MGKRRAFWRTPSGTISRSVQQHAPTELLKGVCESAIVHEGSFDWTTPLGHEYFETLAYSIAISDGDSELDSESAYKIARDGLTDAIRTRKSERVLSAEMVLLAVDRKAAEFYRQEYVQYAFITSMSIHGWPSSEPIEVEGCILEASRDRTKYPIDTEVQERLFGSSLQEHANSHYQTIRVLCCGRSVHEAVAKALNSLDILRGLWTLIWTRGRIFSGDAYRPRPAGVFHLSAFSTLHDLSGRHLKGCWWYDPTYPSVHKNYPWNDDERGWILVELGRMELESHLSKNPMRAVLQSFIGRYARALDHSDDDLAFMHLWALLESITDTGSKSYEDTIKRAAWIFGDHQRHRLLLDYFRVRRNRFVHAGIRTALRAHTQKLKHIVDKHLFDLAENSMKVLSIRVYGDLLQLPNNQSKLSSQRMRIQKAIDYLGSQQTFFGGNGI